MPPLRGASLTKQELKSFDPRVNSFLAKLSHEDLAVFMREAKIVSLKLRKQIVLQDGRVDAVYFPITCMFSLLVTTAAEPQMEMPTIEKEGVIGASEALQTLGSIALSIVQIPGTAVRIDADAFRKLVGARLPVQKIVHQHNVCPRAADTLRRRL
jgi:hypothetical protein